MTTIKQDDASCAPVERLVRLCKKCNGNDVDVHCAYPGEKMQSCLRDRRLKNEAYLSRPWPAQTALSVPENIRNADDFLDEMNS